MPARSFPEVRRILAEHRADLEQRFGIKSIGVFGSWVRDEQTAASDVDILVELTHPTFDQYMDLKFFLEDKLGRPVDLVLADSLKPRLKPIITREVSYA